MAQALGLCRSGDVKLPFADEVPFADRLSVQRKKERRHAQQRKSAPPKPAHIASAALPTAK
jgi:hypothetical protein